MLTRADVERIIDNKFTDNAVLTEKNFVELLKANLRVGITKHNHSDKALTITVSFKGDIVCETNIN